MTQTIAIVVAAGRGQRFGSAGPKQYEVLHGKSVLRHAFDNLLAHGAIGGVLPVIHEDDMEHFKDAAAGIDLLPPVLGGLTRQESVLKGLEALDPATEHVLIHDGARPNPTGALITRVCDALALHDGAIPVLPVRDTLKASDGATVSTTVSREGLYRAQTPQGFHFQPLLAAHRAHRGSELTDDAAVAEAAGLDVAAVSGDENNIKVTEPDDLARLAAILAMPPALMRVGSGFDVHRFGPGRSVTLCGVEIPHDQALMGHSDADVALHAVTDAILGALSLGDIGERFPPTDDQWKDAASEIFVNDAVTQVARKSGQIYHVDLTIICEAPKIAPHRDELRASLARMTGLDIENVSVKATTSEGLGFTGRKEGIAAQATVTLGVPLHG